MRAKQSSRGREVVAAALKLSEEERTAPAAGVPVVRTSLGDRGSPVELVGFVIRA
uniref:Uncharacterized protein n=1 Tax=Zea mays TaxID=4577 RepID=B6SSC6_MAIZE|nr:hypothetical protein [Zea mays]ACG46373.1 hypothetical protein [Zea mays]